MSRDSSERFPRVVGAVTELPEPVATLLTAQLWPEEAPSLILMAPRVALLGVSHGWRSWVLHLLPWRLSAEWVLVRTDRRLILITTSAPGANLEVINIAPDELIAVEIGWKLLFAWFKLQFVREQRVESLTVHFNAVGIEHFRRLVHDLNTATAGTIPLPAPGRNLAPLEAMPFKFKNIIGQRLIPPYERIESAVYRSPARPRSLRLSRRDPGLALVLTNARLLVASEDEGSTRHTTSYGMCAQYIARSRVVGWRVSRVEESCTVQLRYGAHEATETENLRFPAIAEADLIEMFSKISAPELGASALGAADRMPVAAATLG